MCKNVFLLIVTVLIIFNEINALSTADQKTILDCHNNLRASLASGKEQNKTGMMPPGMNIRFLKYSKVVEASAASWANRCTQSHSGGKFGENLSMDGDAKLTTQDALLKACKNWWAELKKLGLQSSLVVDNNNWKGIGHFTQMAWAETFEIGCAVAKCPKAFYKTYVVCQYNKPGNFLGQTVYKKGTQCSGCGNLGCASKGLCN